VSTAPEDLNVNQCRDQKLQLCILSAFDDVLMGELKMAIALQPKFPVPDRSKQPVRSTKDEKGVIDIGWCDGALSDGRAFRAEMWAQDQISYAYNFLQ
jgi:hypothetical protein